MTTNVTFTQQASQEWFKLPEGPLKADIRDKITQIANGEDRGIERISKNTHQHIRITSIIEGDYEYPIIWTEEGHPVHISIKDIGTNPPTQIAGFPYSI